MELPVDDPTENFEEEISDDPTLLLEGIEVGGTDDPPPLREEIEVSVDDRTPLLGETSEEISDDDYLTELLEAAAEFTNGLQSDDSVNLFLQRFPLPVVINVLQTKADVPGVEGTLVDLLESIFMTRFGASLIPRYMAFIQVSLAAESHKVVALAFKLVEILLDSLDGNPLCKSLLIENDVYRLLFERLVNGDDEVTTLAKEAILRLCTREATLCIVFPLHADSEMRFDKAFARATSSLGRIRILELMVHLLSISPLLAYLVQHANIVRLFHGEIRESRESNDTSATITIINILDELARIPHRGDFVSDTDLIKLLSASYSDTPRDSVLRLIALPTLERLISSEGFQGFPLLDGPPDQRLDEEVQKSGEVLHSISFVLEFTAIIAHVLHWHTLVITCSIFQLFILCIQGLQGARGCGLDRLEIFKLVLLHLVIFVSYRTGWHEDDLRTVGWILLGIEAILFIHGCITSWVSGRW